MERKSLESAAQAYSYLRGFLTIPVGLSFVLAGLANEGIGPLRRIWVFWVAIVLLAGSTLVIARYYKGNYGSLTRSPKIQGKEMLLTLLTLPILVAGQQVDWSLDLPIFAMLSTWGVFMLAYYASGVGLGTHHKVIWGAMLIAGLVPVWGALSPEGKSFVGLLTIGTAYMVTGFFDHRVFVRTFGPPKALNLEGSHVGR